MSTPRRRFTVEFINKLKPTAGKRLEVHHQRIPGFIVRITPAGAKCFCFTYRKKIDGTSKHRRKTISSWPVDPNAHADALKNAEAKALELQAAVAKGGDPVGEEREREARKPRGQTVAWLAAEYIARDAKLVVGKSGAKSGYKTWRARESTLKQHWLPVLGDVPIGDVTRRQLRDVLARLIAEGKPGAAGEARKAITRLFNWALEEDYLQVAPLPLKFDKRPSPARQLSDDELAAVWLAAGELGEPWRQAIRVLLLTGCRRNEVLEARRSEITRDRWLEIPAERFKMERPHVVPLSEAAWVEIESLGRYARPDPYVFSCNAGLGPARGIAKIKEQLDAAAEKLLGRPLAPYRLHDLRVTCRSRLAALGVPHDVAEATIGHAKSGLTAIYQQYDFRAERRDALERYAAHVLKLVEEKKRAANE